MADSIPEKVKKESDGLRGTLKESLLDEHTGAIRESDQLLIKFHGMYMQDDRDRRDERAYPAVCFQQNNGWRCTK